jgi:hypothetical protein
LNDDCIEAREWILERFIIRTAFSVHIFKLCETKMVNVDNRQSTQRCSSATSRTTSMQEKSQDGVVNNAIAASFCRRRRTPTLSKLLKARDFEQIRQILSNQSTDCIPWIDKKIGFFGETSLHLLFKVSPPLDVVDAILDKLLDPKNQDCHFKQSNCTGWTPIHVAIAFGCRLDVVSHVLSRLSPETVLELGSNRDGHGRFPLHLACMTQLKSPSKAHAIEQVAGSERLAIVQLLVQVYPAAVAAYDNKGFTPSDYATCSGLDAEVICLLEKTKELVDVTCSFSFHDQVIELISEDDEVSVVTIPADFDDIDQ